MAKIELKKTSNPVRINRYFSEELRRKKVEEIDKRLTTVREVSKEYSVSSTAVYKWIEKYSLMRQKGIKMVVESESDTVRIKELRRYVSELEQQLGKKQFEIDFLTKQIEIISNQYGVDFKKKQTGPLSNGFGKSVKGTDTK